MPFDNLKRPRRVPKKYAREPLIRKFAYATAFSGSILVIMKHGNLIPDARRDQYEEKVTDITPALDKAKNP